MRALQHRLNGFVQRLVPTWAGHCYVLHLPIVQNGEANANLPLLSPAPRRFGIGTMPL
jgi:hypothetical protein